MKLPNSIDYHYFLSRLCPSFFTRKRMRSLQNDVLIPLNVSEIINFGASSRKGTCLIDLAAGTMSAMGQNLSHNGKLRKVSAHFGLFSTSKDRFFGVLAQFYLHWWSQHHSTTSLIPKPQGWFPIGILPFNAWVVKRPGKIFKFSFFTIFTLADRARRAELKDVFTSPRNLQKIV